MTFFTLDDHETPADIRNVLAASAALQITEFRLFELAHERWFDEPAMTEKVEPVFIAYMFQDVVPHWVRHYSRAVLAAQRAGHLLPAEFGVNPRDDRYAEYGVGIRLAVAITIGTLMIFAVAMLVAQYTGWEGAPA